MNYQLLIVNCPSVSFRQKGGNILAEMGKFANDRTGNRSQLRFCNQKNCFNARQLSVDISHLLLVFKILKRAYTPKDGISANRTGIIGSQASIALYAHTRLTFIIFLQRTNPFFHSYPTGLLLIDADGYHHLIKELQSTLHEIRMTQGERVKGAWK